MGQEIEEIGLDPEGGPDLPRVVEEAHEVLGTHHLLLTGTGVAALAGCHCSAWRCEESIPSVDTIDIEHVSLAIRPAQRGQVDQLASAKADVQVRVQAL